MSRTHTHHASNGPGHGSATDDLKDKAGKVGQDLKDVAGAVRDVAGEQYENVRQRAADYVEQGRERVMEWEEGIEGYIKDNPIRSLLIAGGVGLLVGLIWRRK
jgi:ElaB/YqjD/DUF883 family membrane-anchored ribosome-binding protein